jgi:hypothetical protein
MPTGNGAWQFRRGWRLADEAFGAGVVGGVQDLGAACPGGGGPAVVDVGGGVQAEPAVPVLVVVLQRLKLRLGVRVVVGGVRAGVGLGDVPVGQQQLGLADRQGGGPLI